MDKLLVWHFLPENGCLNHTEPPVAVKAGRVYRAPNAVMCESGMHGSGRILDALKYAPGPIITRCELRGTILRGDDKCVATERKVLWVLSREKSERVLHLFACRMAEDALKRESKDGREPDPRSWNAIKVKRAWLDGKATDEELWATRSAACSAADSAADSAAFSAADAAADSAACSAADSAADSAAYSAARSAAYSAAHSAAYSASYSAACWAADSAAYSVAHSAAWAKYNAWLTEMVEAERNG